MAGLKVISDYDELTEFKERHPEWCYYIPHIEKREFVKFDKDDHPWADCYLLDSQEPTVGLLDLKPKGIGIVKVAVFDVQGSQSEPATSL